MPSRKDMVLGRIALERGWLTPKQLEECYQAQHAALKNPDQAVGHGALRPLIGVLIERGLIGEQQATDLLEEQNRRLGLMEDYERLARSELGLGQLLVKHGKATQIQINKCLEIQQKLAEQGKSPVPRLGELLVQHGYVDAKTIQEILKYQRKELLICTNCTKQFNVIGVERGKTYRCNGCGGIMVTQDMLKSLRSDDETMFEFELPTEGPPPEA